MRKKHLIKAVTHSWWVSTKIKKQSKQKPNKLPKKKEGWHFLAIPHEVDSGLPALVVQCSSLPKAPNVPIQSGCYLKEVESLPSCLSIVFNTILPATSKLRTKSCILCLAYNKLRWWILTFLTTVILFLSCIEITCSSLNSVFSSIKRAKDDRSSFANGLQSCSASTPAANMVKSYCFSPLWTMIITMFQEKPDTYHISGPKISRFFTQNLCHFVHFGSEQFHFDSFTFGKKRCTLSKLLAPFSFSHVTDSCPFLISYSFFLSVLIL